MEFTKKLASKLVDGYCIYQTNNDKYPWTPVPLYSLTILPTYGHLDKPYTNRGLA